MEIADNEILLTFRESTSRERGFTMLVTKYQQRLYWMIRRMLVDHDDADDVLQNTFIKVWKGLENFREDSQLYTWLYRIATNETLSWINQTNRRAQISMDKVEYSVSNKLSSDKYFNGNEIERKLQVAMAALPEKQRLVFQLRYYDEMPYEEMSNVLGTSEGALKASFHHAVKKVEKYLLAD